MIIQMGTKRNAYSITILHGIMIDIIKWLLKVSTAIGVHNLIESKIRLFQTLIDYSLTN